MNFSDVYLGVKYIGSLAKGFSHFFNKEKNGVFQILTFEFLTKR